MRHRNDLLGRRPQSITNIIFIFLLIQKINGNSVFGGNPMMQYHVPLSCNALIEDDDCDNTTLSSLLATTPNCTEVIIPCGECVRVDISDGSTVTLSGGLNIQGKLYFPSSSSLTIRTTHVFVMGVLRMDPPETSVRFQMFGTEEQFLHPIGENLEMEVCDPLTGCNMGKKPFAVAGGRLDIHGLADPTCPSWVRLLDLQSSTTTNSTSNLNRLDVGAHATSCWRTGDSIFLTPPDSNLNNAFNTTVVGTEGTFLVVADEVPEAFVHATLATSPEFAVEVASMSRRIVFGADYDDGKIGGHFIIYHTRYVQQFVEGVESVNFGQQGILGRYPFHFHMSSDVSGSVFSKNVAHHSNHRAFAVHNSHNATLIDNVAYEVSGHCFFVEDGVETGNTFEHNLGAVCRNIASSDVVWGENDSLASVFWITNPGNHWINNVAAGAGNSGYWFDCRKLAKGASATMLGTDTPGGKYVDLLTFRGNVAHANYIGLKTYDPPWLPTSDEGGLLEDCAIYRNINTGVHFHRNRNIVVRGGVLADNPRATDMFNNRLGIVFENVRVIGKSGEYRAVASFSCEQALHLYPSPQRRTIDEVWPAIRLENITFSGFGDDCNVAPIEIYGRGIEDVYDGRDEIQGIVYDDVEGERVGPMFSACWAESSGMDTVAVHNLDGSLDPLGEGTPGFLVTDVEKMTRFGNCTPIPDSCSSFCRECMRRIDVETSSASSNQAIDLVLSNPNGQEVAVSSTGSYSGLYDRRKYYTALPVGNFTFAFRDRNTGEDAWPGWASPLLYAWEPACPHPVTTIMADLLPFDETRCAGNLLGDGTFDDPDSTWDLQGDDTTLEVVQPGAAGSEHALRAQGDDGILIGQWIEPGCTGPWTVLEFSSDVRFVHSTWGFTVGCHGDLCPKAVFDFAVESDIPTTTSTIATVSDEAVDGWYRMQGSLVLNEHYSHETRIRLLRIVIPPQSSPLSFYMEIDNVSLTAIAVTSPTTAPTLPPVPTISPLPTPSHSNLALNRPCTQSSTSQNGLASLAVDGNTDGNYDSGSVTLTDTGNNYWQVDLQVIAAIHTITLYNRADCCAEQLNGATVFILDHASRVVESRTLTEESPAVVEFAFNGAEGTYVRVNGIVPNVLSLAEVEVYGVVAGEVPTYGPTFTPTAVPTTGDVDLSGSVPYTYTYSNGAPDGCCGGFYDDPFLEILNDRGPVPQSIGMSNCISFSGNDDDSLPLLDLGIPYNITEIVLTYHNHDPSSKYAPKSLLFRGSLINEEDWSFETRRSEGFPFPDGVHSVRLPISDWGSVQYIELSEVVPSKSQSVVSRISVFVSTPMEPTISPTTGLSVYIPYEYFYSNGFPESESGGYYDDPCLDILNADGIPDHPDRDNSIRWDGTDSDSMPVFDLGSPHFITEVIVSYINAYDWAKYAPQSVLIRGSLTREDDWTTWTFQANVTEGFRTPNGGHSSSLIISGWGKVQYIQLSEVIPSQGASLVSRIAVFGYENVSLIPSAAPTACTRDELTVNLTVDEYPTETKWTVTNKATGNLVVSNPALCLNDIFQTTLCLPENCYIFEITDTFHDGICCEYGLGSFSVILGGTEILTGSNFGSSASVEFCVEESTSLSPTISPTETGTLPPSTVPTEADVLFPTSTPTNIRDTPTDVPTDVPTDIPTDVPTDAPTNAPTDIPTDTPTDEPTLAPTNEPTLTSTDSPTIEPTVPPTESPTEAVIPCENSGLPISHQGFLFSCTQVAAHGACSNHLALSHCPYTCNACQEYACENSLARWKIYGREAECDLLANLDHDKIAKLCAASNALSTTCRSTCEYCNN